MKHDSFENPESQEQYEDIGKTLEERAVALLEKAKTLAQRGPQWHGDL